MRFSSKLVWVLTLQICSKILYDFQAIISCVWVLAYSKGEKNHVKQQKVNAMEIKQKLSSTAGAMALTFSPKSFLTTKKQNIGASATALSQRS